MLNRYHFPQDFRYSRFDFIKHSFNISRDLSALSSDTNIIKEEGSYSVHQSKQEISNKEVPDYK